MMPVQSGSQKAQGFVNHHTYRQNWSCMASHDVSAFKLQLRLVVKCGPDHSTRQELSPWQLPVNKIYHEQLASEFFGFRSSAFPNLRQKPGETTSSPVPGMTKQPWSLSVSTAPPKGLEPWMRCFILRVPGIGQFQGQQLTATIVVILHHGSYLPCQETLSDMKPINFLDLLKILRLPTAPQDWGIILGHDPGRFLCQFEEQKDTKGDDV